tara:strand:+ start:2446 stop:3147 length:702 start_codon:yes stop_codon:yes gene_type:complete
MSKIKVNEIEAQSGSTITIPTGQTLTVTDGMAASTITSGTLADARLPTVPVTKGGTGLTSLGTANQVLAVNSGASALEFQDAASGKVKQIVTGVNSSGATSSSVSISGYSGGSIPNNVGTAHVTLNITPTSSSSKLICMANAPSGTGNNATGLVTITVDQVAIAAVTTNGYSADASGVTLTGWIQNSSTSQRTIEFRTVGTWGGNVVTLGQIRNGHTTSFNGHYGSLIVMEVE